MLVLSGVLAHYIDREMLQLLPDDCGPVVAQTSISFMVDGMPSVKSILTQVTSRGLNST